ncbi:MAG: 16S rRNA (guanine(527)-N(7))-methyltransferase RsmG [Dysosmobacter sp.]
MMEQRLQSGLAALNLPVEGIPALVRYGDLLIETNKVMNLTAITDPEDVATLHFLDSAALLTLESFSGKSVVDVGTGAGFPGLPLRVLEPSIRLTLLDSLNKRIQFLEDGVPGAGPPRCGLRPRPGGGICRGAPGNL